MQQLALLSQKSADILKLHGGGEKVIYCLNSLIMLNRPFGSVKLLRETCNTLSALILIEPDTLTHFWSNYRFFFPTATTV